MRTKWISDDKIVNFIRDHRNRYGVSPTMREITKECGFSSTGALTQRIKMLQEEGRIVQFKKGAARAYVVVDL